MRTCTEQSVENKVASTLPVHFPHEVKLLLLANNRGLWASEKTRNVMAEVDNLVILIFTDLSEYNPKATHVHLVVYHFAKKNPENY